MQTIGPLTISSGAGGVSSLFELHSNGLITADRDRAVPVGQLAERPPTTDDGSLALLPDGRARAVYHLRPNVTWQDGAPFGADDLVFSYRVLSDPGLPIASGNTVIPYIESVEAPDATTFVMNFKGPYYAADAVGFRDFWPLPRHLLQEPFERYQAEKDAEVFTRLAFWTSGYVQLGPFRVTELDPGQGLTLEAYSGYYLGQPKIARVTIQVYAGDGNTLFAGLLAGTVDLIMNSALPINLGFLLKDQWEQSGQGAVHLTKGVPWLMESQWRQGVQVEHANLEPKVRAALYYALDRDTLSEGLFSGHSEFAAYAILPPNDRNYPAVQDALRRYAYDPDRSRALFREAGWVTGPDGTLVNAADGRQFRSGIRASPGRATDVAALADQWRRLGIDVTETMINPAEYSDARARAIYPGWYSTTLQGADQFLNKLEGVPAGPENNWQGNGSGYESPTAMRLINAYRTGMGERENREAMKAISDFIVDELPLIFTWYNALQVGVRKGVGALDDFDGGGTIVGTYSRNAHLWTVQSSSP